MSYLSKAQQQELERVCLEVLPGAKWEPFPLGEKYTAFGEMGVIAKYRVDKKAVYFRLHYGSEPLPWETPEVFRQHAVEHLLACQILVKGMAQVLYGLDPPPNDGALS